MLYLRLQHIAPHTQHLQPIRMIEVILKIELVEPQWRDEGGPVRGRMRGAEEGECEIWARGGLAGGGGGGGEEGGGGGRGGGQLQEDLFLAVGWAEGVWWEGTEFED
jgi:hypothetical protein